ncbi:MAG: DUF484 family protein [Marinibacterium sp.]
MTSSPKLSDDARAAIIAAPDTVLDDRDVMTALIAENERSMGGNIVDLRGIAMERLEARLDRLEDTHRSVIAAAYENLAGTNQVHRAILRMLDPTEFEAFLANLGGEVAEILRVDSVTLLLETAQSDDDASFGALGDILRVTAPGTINDYLGLDAGARPRPVTLRQVQDGKTAIHGETGNWIRSEACLTLDFGAGRLPGMLALGAEDPHQFAPHQGTELLGFFAGVFERSMRHWLS